VSRTKRSKQWRLCAGLLAFFPWFGTDQAAEQAVREGNVLYQSGSYDAALDRYTAASSALPDAAVIPFNQGNAWFQKRDYDRALESYLAALTTEDPKLKSRAKYNIGVVKFRQSLGALAALSDALPLAQVAVQYLRESLELDPDQDDARYNLELAYQLLHQIEAKLLENQRNQERQPNKTNLQRGQAMSNIIRNEGGGQRNAMPDVARRPHGEYGNEQPENFASNQQQTNQSTDATLPVAMSPEAAGQLMEQLLQKVQATETWVQQKRRAQMQDLNPDAPW